MSHKQIGKDKKESILYDTPHLSRIDHSISCSIKATNYWILRVIVFSLSFFQSKISAKFSIIIHAAINPAFQFDLYSTPPNIQSGLDEQHGTSYSLGNTTSLNFSSYLFLFTKVASKVSGVIKSFVYSNGSKLFA